MWFLTTKTKGFPKQIKEKQKNIQTISSMLLSCDSQHKSE